VASPFLSYDISMLTYEEIRKNYRPTDIKILLVAESPPPAATVESGRHFYRTDKIRKEDRLFVNTVKALYADATKCSEKELETNKEQWLHRLQSDGWYMIEALEESQQHETTKEQRQALIRENLPKLIQRIKQLTSKDTKLILIKSNVFEAAGEALRAAGFHVLNTELVDYPGRFNQGAYRRKLAELARGYPNAKRRE
jgi:hypothetical protein